MKTSTVIIIVVAAVVVAVVTFLIVRRVRYVSGLRARGWTFESSPALGAVLHHAAPPFGLGLSRSTDEMISGTTSAGLPFGVFEYAYQGAGRAFDERLASVRLPVPLPPVFVTAGPGRPGVLGVAVEVAPGLTVRSEHPDAARAILSPAVLAAVGSFARQQTADGRPVDLSVDGEWLVAVGAPKQADDLQPYLESLARVAGSVDAAAVTPYAVERPTPGFTFFGRPDWIFVDRDDSLVDLYGVDHGGHDQQAVKIVRATNDGLRLDAFEHRWKTTRTETSTDANGNTTTRTVTEQHDEPVLVVNLPFTFGFLNVNSGWGGEKVSFESEPFNDAYKVRTRDARFASDVIHPRMMELIMAWRPVGFVIDGARLTFGVSAHDQFLIAHCADFAHAFFGAVPAFVWANLRVQPPAFRGVGGAGGAGASEAWGRGGRGGV